MEDIDKFLQKGLKHLNWKSMAINEFVGSTMTKVSPHPKISTLNPEPETQNPTT